MPGLTFLITAGPTVEDIDPVRFISNRATGKLGVALAAETVRRGHRAVLIHGPVHPSVILGAGKSKRLAIHPVRSAEEMCRATLKASRSADVVIMSAAVADYTPEKTAATKLKKAKQGMILRLKPTVDILRELGRRKGAARKPILIGFALETGSGSKASARRRSRLSEALRKLRDKNLDAIVLDTPAEMAADSGNFTVLLRDGQRTDYRGLTKAQFAKVLIGLVKRCVENAR